MRPRQLNTSKGGVMSAIETMNDRARRRGREYPSTQVEFQGIVKVTEVGSGMAHYMGDAEGFAAISGFIRACRPGRRSEN